MKKILFNGIALSLLAVAVISCKPKTEEPAPEENAMVEPADIKTEIQALETAYADHMNAGKPEDVIYYADDATSYSQDKPASVGKKAILQNMKDQIAEAPAGAKVAYTTNEVYPSSDGKQVVELGSYTLTDSTSNSVIAKGNFMAMFQKRNGKYFCVRDMGISDQPRK